MEMESWITQVAIWQYQNADNFTTITVTGNIHEVELKEIL